MQNVKIEGHKGTFSEIKKAVFGFRNHGINETLHLMESNLYGEDYPFLLIDKEGQLIADGLVNGFEDFQYLLDESIPKSEWIL